jgi:opacity protein-like surface antigen
MMKKNKTILISLLFIFATKFLQAQIDTVWVDVARIDTLKEVKERNKKREIEREKEKLYELKKDIERLNSNSVSKKKVYVVDTVYVKKEKRVLGKPPRFYRHELGVETGAFFNQLFRVFGLVRDTQNFPVSPYVISYKYRPNEKGAARLGAGISTYKLTENRGAFADTKTVTNQNYDVRLGYEFNIPLDDRWLSYMGLDGTFGSNKQNTEFDSGFDRNQRKIVTNSYGLAFVLGIRYDFSWRVSLGSEMGFGFINKESQETNEFTANPQFNSIVRKFSEQQTKFNGPGNVYISIRF